MMDKAGCLHSVAPSVSRPVSPSVTYRSWDALKLWLVDDKGEPMWDNLSGLSKHGGNKHDFFPCQQQVAWVVSG